MVFTESPVRQHKTAIHTLAEQQGITTITKTMVKQLARETREFEAGEKAGALRRIFGPELDTLQRPNQEVHATNLFLPLLKEIFDKGSMSDMECRVKHADEVVTMKEKAVPFLKRTPFLTQVLKNEQQIANGEVSMGRIDLARFRDADFATAQNPKGTKPADTIINITARTMRDVLREYWLEKHMNYDTDFYEVGRYGGDELIVAFIGKEAQVHREKVMDLVMKRLATREGYYRIGNTDWVEVMPILIKKGPGAEKGVEWIHFPEEHNGEKVMYREYLEKGLVLSGEEFKREKMKYTVDGQFKLELYRKDNPKGRGSVAYPESVNSIGDKITYLSRRHPELAVYFDLARLFDSEDKTEGSPSKRQETLLKLVENSIFDSLLGEMIYSRSHFVEHMAKGELDSLQVFDFKFLKEMNTAMTYADADNSIKMLWEKIKEAIPKNERNKVIVSRFAGAFYVGVRKGGALSDECQEKLNAIVSLPFGKDAEFEIPLGHDYVVFDSDVNKGFNPHKIINKLEENAERTYYHALVTDIVREQGQNDQFISQMMTLDIDGLKKREYQSLSKMELYAFSLRGQRKLARIGKLIEYVDLTGLYEDPTYIELRGLLKKELG